MTIIDNVVNALMGLAVGQLCWSASKTVKPNWGKHLVLLFYAAGLLVSATRILFEDQSLPTIGFAASLVMISIALGWLSKEKTLSENERLRLKRDRLKAQYAETQPKSKDQTPQHKR